MGKETSDLQLTLKMLKEIICIYFREIERK